MKGFKIMFEQTKRFYLAVFLCALLYVVLDCTFICNDNQVMTIDAEKITSIEESLKTQNAITVFKGYAISLDGVMLNKVTEVLGFSLTLLLIGIALLIKEYAYMDSRTREFRQMWPIKNWVREIYYYIMMLGIILLSFVIQMVILLFVQNRYSNMLIEYLGLDVNQIEVKEIIALNNGNLIITMMVAYVLPVVVNYTWIYLGMIVAKNPLVGMVLSMVVKNAVAFLYDGVVWSVLYETFVWEERQAEMWVHTYVNNALELFDSLLYESEIKYYFGDWLCVRNGFEHYGNYYNPQIMNIWIWVKVISILVFVLCIIFVAKKKELSSGGLFYFPVLNVLFSLLIGTMIFLLMIETFIYSSIPIVGVVLGCFALSIAIFLLIRPAVVKKTKRLEVK